MKAHLPEWTIPGQTTSTEVCVDILCELLARELLVVSWLVDRQAQRNGAIRWDESSMSPPSPRSTTGKGPHEQPSGLRHLVLPKVSYRSALPKKTRRRCLAEVLPKLACRKCPTESVLPRCLQHSCQRCLAHVYCAIRLGGATASLPPRSLQWRCECRCRRHWCR